MNSVVECDINGNMNKYKAKMGCAIHVRTNTQTIANVDNSKLATVMGN